MLALTLVSLVLAARRLDSLGAQLGISAEAAERVASLMVGQVCARVFVRERCTR
jgi:hypothetical protein